MAQTLTDLRIDGARLYASLHDLGKIGAYKDERSGLTGVNRLALTEQDGEARRLVIKWMMEAGMEVSIDDIGNTYAVRSGKDDSLAPVMMGSHIDSVPTAGIFDGCLGVLGGLEIIRTLNDKKIRTRRPLAVAFFSEEEGCRFGTDMLGSAVATGRIGVKDAYELTDKDGKRVEDELEATGFVGEAVLAVKNPHAFLECHIEQGPTLRAENLDIGVVTGVQGISWLELEIIGASAHAGTTPISYRKDAGLAAARIQTRLREMCLSGDYGADMRATVGMIEQRPGMVNVIAGRVRCSVDLRNPDDGAMKKQEDDLLAFCDKIEKEEGVQITWTQTAKTPMVPFDAGVQKAIADSADRLKLSHRPILSGAGHDAQEWSRVCKTAMVFVPGENEGISHNPRELSTETQCADGVNVMLGAAMELADEN